MKLRQIACKLLAGSMFTVLSVVASAADQVDALAPSIAGKPLPPMPKGKRAGKKPDEVFVSFVLPHWKKYYDKYYTGHYPAPSDRELRRIGIWTFNEAFDYLENDDYSYMFALIMLNWRARTLGLDMGFIKDATIFWRDANEFGVKWYEYQLTLLERARAGQSDPGLLGVVAFPTKGAPGS